MKINLIGEQGQIVILDVLFAVVLVTLLFFLLSRWIEMDIYTSNTNKVIYEVDKVGHIALNRLTSNPEINCYASDNNNSFLIPACISSTSAITKQGLGIPSNFNCSFSVNGLAILNNQCTQSLPADEVNYFKYDFNVIVSSSRVISKKEYMSNILGKSSTINTAEATLVVWK